MVFDEQIYYKDLPIDLELSCLSSFRWFTRFSLCCPGCRNDDDDDDDDVDDDGNDDDYDDDDNDDDDGEKTQTWLASPQFCLARRPVMTSNTMFCILYNQGLS